MNEHQQRRAPRARVAHSVRGRLRVKIESPRGHGKLHQVATALREMPDTLVVHANHAARSVTVSYDPHEVSGLDLLRRLCHLGIVALDLTDPAEWAEMLAEEVVPRAEDARTLPGRVNRELLFSTRGKVDLFRITVGLLLVTAAIQVRRALLRGDAIPWLRLLTYLLAAASIWTRRTGHPRGAPLLADRRRHAG